MEDGGTPSLGLEVDVLLDNVDMNHLGAGTGLYRRVVAGRDGADVDEYGRISGGDGRRKGFTHELTWGLGLCPGWFLVQTSWRLRDSQKT